MIALETARQRILDALPAPVAETRPLAAAAGRFLAHGVASPLDLPLFDNSAMDGYAVRAADVAGASAASPVRLRVIGRIPAGASFAGAIGSGECARLFTGSLLPAGADAIVMQEDTQTDAARPGEVLICDAARPGESVRHQGEDVRRGATIASAGAELSPGRLALLAATGIGEVAVGRQPIVGLLATGSELREAGQPLSPGQIYESNRVMLAALVACAGGAPKVYPLVPDTLGETSAALATAFAECDLVVTSGGVSVGEMDFVKLAFEQLGGHLEFWKVAIRPGKPFVFGRLREKFLFGLPGNPVSAFVTFLLLVRPALLRWQGAGEIELHQQPGVLAEAMANRGGRRHFCRVQIDENGRVCSAGQQASHALNSLAKANGLLDLPVAAELAAGTPVQVLRW